MSNHVVGLESGGQVGSRGGKDESVQYKLSTLDFIHSH